MTEIKIGNVYSFSVTFGRHHRNHVAKVQVISCEKRYDVMDERGAFSGMYFICRRTDNGTPILALLEDLSEVRE